jgi:hypothetical protein
MDFHFLQTPAQKSAKETPRPKMLEDIQKRMCTLIAQHGSVLAVLTALRQHLEAQRNDEQTNSLENPVPHIDVLAEFNQGTLDLHMNVAIAYRENGVLSNVNNLIFAMPHYNCLETKMHQPRDDGIVEKWTQYVGSAMRKCGSKNDRQS